MLAIILEFMMTCIMLRGVRGSPAVEGSARGLRYEEYIIEHAISYTQAKNSALAIDLKSIVAPPGCQNCTAEEIKYCLSPDLVNDHCCCDKRYHEVLPYIPHTCYIGTTLCKPVAPDCDVYARLRNCCCDRYVMQLWKGKLSSAYKESSSNFFGGLLILTLVNIFLCLFYI